MSAPAPASSPSLWPPRWRRPGQPRPPRPPATKELPASRLVSAPSRTSVWFQAAGQKQLDYSTLANPTTGPIYTTLPEGSYLSLGQVVKLHTANPELFAWCR